MLKKQSQEERCSYRYIDWLCESAHVMMEAEKSHDLPSANWRVKRSSSSFPPKLSPKAREAEKPWYTSWTKPEYLRLGIIDTEGQKKYRCPSSNSELVRLLSAFFFYLGLQQPECIPSYR